MSQGNGQPYVEKVILRRLDLTPGTRYLYRPPGKERPCGPYCVLGLGKHVHSDQQLVVYQVEGGGQIWLAPLHDFALRFEQIQEPSPNGQAAEPNPDRIAGYKSTSKFG